MKYLDLNIQFNCCLKLLSGIERNWKWCLNRKQIQFSSWDKRDGSISCCSHECYLLWPLFGSIYCLLSSAKRSSSRLSLSLALLSERNAGLRGCWAIINRLLRRHGDETAAALASPIDRFSRRLFLSLTCFSRCFHFEKARAAIIAPARESPGAGDT